MSEREILHRLAEAKSGKALTDAGMKAMIPLYVVGQTPDEDHKCGNCSMRVPGRRCTVVEGDIDMADGVCSLWAKGPASSPADQHGQKMPKSASPSTPFGESLCLA